MNRALEVQPELATMESSGILKLVDETTPLPAAEIDHLTKIECGHYRYSIGDFLREKVEYEL